MLANGAQMKRHSLSNTDVNRTPGSLGLNDQLEQRVRTIGAATRRPNLVQYPQQREV